VFVVVVSSAVVDEEAFNFYYNDLFDILGAKGAEVETFSPVHDRFPEADGYIIGGFDGTVRNLTQGGYTHLHPVAASEMIGNFVDNCFL